MPQEGKRRSKEQKLLILFLTLISFVLTFEIKAGQESARPSPSHVSSALRGATQPHFEKIAEGKFIEENGHYRFIYTLDPALQIWTWDFLSTYRPSYASFIALDPRTGRLLVLADYAQEKPYYPGVWPRATYPAASIFKIVTAASALENGLLRSNSPVFFRGNQYLLSPQKLSANNKYERQINFDEALGKSNNVVFGRIASKLLGAQLLRKGAAAFGFNQLLPFDFPLEQSRAVIPEEPYELARCGAGFGEITLNPLHAATIAGLIANKGVLMRPYIIAAMDNQQHKRIYEAKPEVISQPISPRTAAELTRMMIRTVEDGTAAKTFQPAGKKFLKNITVCGKTGHLSGTNPPGIYHWFIGFAPVENPQIAFAALIINQNGQRLKGTLLAREFLKEFFREMMD